MALWRCGVVCIKGRLFLLLKFMPRELRESCFICKERILDEDSVVCLDCDTVFCDGCLPDNKPCPVCYFVVGRVV